MSDSPMRRAPRAELAPIHDFAAKLCQPAAIDHLRAYVELQRNRRHSGMTIPEATAAGNSALAPLSINLDLTTACNYACDHCVDADILNLGIRFSHDRLMASLELLASRGLRSIILIGGGEPTTYPRFAETVAHIKDLGLALGLVSNGGRLDRVLGVAGLLRAGDWIRLSLDSGTDATFQRMHRPRRAISLEQICAAVRPIKQANPDVSLGFSFIVTWSGCTANDAAIHENIGEMVEAARLARDSGFDYISFKPFLTRAEASNAEVIGLTQEEDRLAEVIKLIRSNINAARLLADAHFSVVESTNLRVLENGTYQQYREQPRTCHMTFFRQVLSPLGTFACPVYRAVPQARIGGSESYADPASAEQTARRTLEIIDSFDASERCREVTCLYNHANWFIEDLIGQPDAPVDLPRGEDRPDFFL